jgi:hypothetical protein
MNCLICGAPLSVGAMFCGECGSSTKATPRTRKRPDPRPSDTTIIQPLRPRTSVISVPIDSGFPAAEPSAVVPPVAASPGVVPPAAAPPVAVRPASPHRGSHAAPVGAAPAISFVLQFSTGEAVEVTGTGLVGRRPIAQPGENFDRLLQIADPGMSVSKSHLEFGQHDGEFWVNDRFSGNGTVIRRPDATMVRCEPGRRYLVPRGSRVEIGDQYFQLS